MAYQILVSDRDAAICLQPKIGTQSMRECLTQMLLPGQTADLTQAEADTKQFRVQFFRNPIDRFISAYRFFKRQYAENLMTDKPFPDAVVATWGDFVDYAIANPTNDHWSSQLVTLAAFNPNRVHRFEEIHLHWLRYHSYPFGWLNRSRKYQVNNIPNALFTHCRDELIYWHSL